ncbi:MAG: ABC transporter permease [Ilumatobacteraceae bacterium]
MDRGLRQDWRGVKIVWQRELIRFRQDRLRAIAALVQPVLFLFVLGTGLETLTEGATGGIDLRTFMFPGVLATSVLFTATFSAASIVWDREFGFLREMLVAPVRRGSILVGKALGGATVATGQSLIILALAGTVGVPYDPLMMLSIVGQLFLLSFALCAVGLVIAARVQQIQSMMGVMQMLLLPLSFLSGALYPVSDLPTWLEVVTLLNPVTYAVHAMRTTVFDVLDASPQALALLNPPLEWFGWEVPIVAQLAVVVALGLALLWFAIAQFNRAE